MLNWDTFSQELDIGSLVPEELAPYRAAVVDGVAFFLQNLSADRLPDILAEQAVLPETADAGGRVVALARHCPALHKLGQILARDRRLPWHFRSQLQRLETMAPQGDLSWVHEELERQCDATVRRDIFIDETPLAEASVALIVPFKWKNKGKNSSRTMDAHGVLKLLKPGIEYKLEEDLELLQQIGAFLDDRCRHYGLPEIHYEDTFCQVRELLAREVQLDGEQQHMRTARKAYAHDKFVIIPKVFEFSTPRMTAMSRIFGHSVTDVAHLSLAEKRSHSEKIVNALLSQPIWSSTETTLFHADPHAGNLLFTDDGKLALLDWSLVGHLNKSDQLGLTQILLGAMTSDNQRVVAAINDLSETPYDKRSLPEVVDLNLRKLTHGFWPSLKWLTALMDQVTITSGIRFRRDLVMFRKVLHTTQGVVADISEDCRFNWVLASPFLAGLAKETGYRLIASPFSHQFSTHFSNAELAHLACSAPLIGWGQLVDLQGRMLDHVLPKPK